MINLTLFSQLSMSHSIEQDGSMNISDK